MNKSNSRLSVYLSSRRVSWSILDTVHRKVVSITDIILEKGHVESQWMDACKMLDEHDLGMKAFGSVMIALDHGNSALVPQALFTESELSAYLEFGISAPENPVKDFIKNIGAYNIYSIPNGLLESLRGVFEKFEVAHVSTPFIENILAENKNHHDHQLFAFLSGNTLHLAALDAGKFAFYNSFKVNAKEDFTYYLIAVVEELNFHPEQIKIALSGDITPDSDYYQTARRFLKQIIFSDRPKALKYSAKLDHVPRHLFAPFYSIHLCE